MSEAYSTQLRSDSIFTVVPTATILTVLISLLAIVISSPDQFISLWSVWLTIVCSIAAGYTTIHLARAQQQQRAGIVFIGVHVILLSLVMSQLWQPGSSLPYLYAIFIVLSSMLIDVIAGFVTWLVSTILMLIAIAVSGLFSFSEFFLLLIPISINFFLALCTFLMAIDWKVAVESVSDLQRKAQHRRDELFGMKEELSLTNAKLHFLNSQLDQARQAAVDERDLRTRFMNNVSHELRTPLNAIVNFAYILYQGGRGQVSEDQADYLKRIELAGRHLLTVLNDLLDLARIESGEFNLHFEITDLQAICEEAMTSTRGLILDKEETIELIRDYPAEWPLVKVDKMRLKQALINLLGNAAKYTDEGHIALRVFQADHTLHVTVEDSGMGIPAEYHEVIYQEFRQVDSTAARRRVGTGLGLPITKHLIERHGGELTLTSEVGRGSAFTISLPLATEEKIEAGESMAVAPEPAPGKITPPAKEVTVT